VLKECLSWRSGGANADVYTIVFTTEKYLPDVYGVPPVRDKLDLYYLPRRGIGVSFFWVIRHTFTTSEYIARSKKLFNPKCNRSGRVRDPVWARVRFYCSTFKTATVRRIVK